MFDKIKDVLRLNKALGQYEDIRKEVDAQSSKQLITSKTFWLNVVGFAATISGLLPQKWAIPVMTVVNIGNRLLTDQPVHLFPPGEK